MTDAWTRKYIFPGAYIPALSELVAEFRQRSAMEIRLEIDQLERLRRREQAAGRLPAHLELLRQQ